MKNRNDYIQNHKNNCITDIGNIHTDGVSKIFVTILASLAEIERENISIRIKASKQIAREERKHLGGYLPTGYRKDENGILIPDDKEFEIVKSIFSLRKSGLKIRQISDVIKNKFGRKIHFTQCHRILNREYNQKLLQIS